MSSASPPQSGPHPATLVGRDAAHWFIRLRWSAAIGSCLLLAALGYFGGMTIAIRPLSAILAILIVSNLYLEKQFRSSGAVSLAALRIALLTDTVLLTAGLAVSGGPANPFSVFYLVHIVVAALILGASWTWAMSAISILLYGLLFFVSGPGQHDHGMHASSFHLEGMWFAFALTATLIAFFAHRILTALREHELVAAELRLRAARAEQFAALVNLAAGAAHELGTPLGTIAIAAGELKRGLENGRAAHLQADDAALISEQVSRCKEILESMSAKSGEVRGEMPTTFSLEEIGRELLKRTAPMGISSSAFRAFDSSVNLTLPREVLVRSLYNLVRNGVEAGSGAIVTVTANRREGEIEFRVQDTGSGIPADLLHRIGEPFLTTKPAGKGMGLGVFLVKVFAERFGGSLEYRTAAGEGTTAELRLPLTAA